MANQDTKVKIVDIQVKYQDAVNAMAKYRTAIDEAKVSNADEATRKVLVGDRIYIIRGNEVYTIQGVRTSKLQRGLNIIVRDGKAQKVIVK